MISENPRVDLYATLHGSFIGEENTKKWLSMCAAMSQDDAALLLDALRRYRIEIESDWQEFTKDMDGDPWTA